MFVNTKKSSPFPLFSATGGADSRVVSEKGSPTEEQAGMVGNGIYQNLLYENFNLMNLLPFSNQ